MERPGRFFITVYQRRSALTATCLPHPPHPSDSQLYEKRKLAALEVEQLVREAGEAGQICDWQDGQDRLPAERAGRRMYRASLQLPCPRWPERGAGNDCTAPFLKPTICVCR